MTVVFEKGEAELRADPALLADDATRLTVLKKWCADALMMATSRRRGDATALLLSNGQLLRGEDVKATSPELLPVFHRLMKAQQTGNVQDAVDVVEICAQHPPFRRKLFETGDVLRSMYGPKPVIQMNLIWDSFFGCVFGAAESALNSGLLTPQDLADQEPWMYLGLTSITALETVLRAPPTGPFRLALRDLEVSLENMPEEGKGLFCAFQQLREQVVRAQLTPAEANELRRSCLWSDREEVPPGFPPLTQDPRIMRIVAGVSSIATQATQLPTYKANFQQAIELLTSLYANS
jgi:hypothetical protein